MGASGRVRTKASEIFASSCRTFAILTLAPACGGSQGASGASARAGVTSVHEPWNGICAPVVGGADVAVALLARGVSIEVTTVPGRAGDVRERFGRLAAALQSGGPGPGIGLGSVGVVARSEDMDAGARLVLECVDAADMLALSTAVSDLLARMHDGGCPPPPPTLSLTPSYPPDTPPPPKASGHSHH